MKGKLIYQAKWAFIVGIVLIIISPFIFTRNLGAVDFSSTGQIGDTIGGITAPIVNLLGALLVFFALKAQVDANSLIQAQIESQRQEELKKKNLQYFLEQFKMIREDINDFSYFKSEPGRHVIHKGSDAFNHVLQDARHLKISSHQSIFQDSPKLFEVQMLLTSIQNFIVQLEKSDLEPDDKTFYKSLVSYQYLSKINGVFQAHNKFRGTIVEKEQYSNDKAIPEVLFIINEQIVSKLI